MRLNSLVSLGLLAIFAGGCRPASVAPATSAAVSATAPNTAARQSEANAASKKPERPAFDGDRAFALLKKQCDFGPRYLGSKPHDELRDYLLEEMKKYADETIAQEFTYRKMTGTNVVGVFNPRGATEPSKAPILLMAHWDTRPIADSRLSAETRRGVAFKYGPEGWNRLTPILGANDAASGVAVLLELARLFKQQKPDVGVVILLTDGEDYGDFRANGGEGEGVTLGAIHFAKHFQENKAFGFPHFGILLDMVGAKNLVILREEFSQRYAPGTNEKVFRIAQELGYGRVFQFSETQEVDDDHLSLNQAGILTIDLIQPFGTTNPNSYSYWHTLQDTPDKCSAKSLKIVGETVAEVIYREQP